MDTGIPSSPKIRIVQKMKSGDSRRRGFSPQFRGSSPRGKVNEHFSIVSGDFTLHDDSYGYFAVENASNDREILTDKRNLAQETKFGNILMVL